MKEAPSIVTDGLRVGVGRMRNAIDALLVLIGATLPVGDEGVQRPVNAPLLATERFDQFDVVEEANGQILKRVDRMLFLSGITRVFTPPANKSGPTGQLS